MAGQLHIGTSGWCYEQWKDGFYHGVARARWLEHCARHFTGLEINRSFYRQVTAETFRDWRQRTPPRFRFTLKGHRFVTHNKKLRDVDASVVRLRDPARALGDRLAVVVWQLPASLRKDMSRLVEFVRTLGRRWRRVRHALELRHDSWFDDEVAACLRDHRLAVCLSDAAHVPRWDMVTTDLVYVRLHGRERSYASSYGDPELRSWARRAQRWLDDGCDVHIYFDNDAEGAAPENALTLLRMLGRAPMDA